MIFAEHKDPDAERFGGRGLRLLLIFKNCGTAALNGVIMSP